MQIEMTDEKWAQIRNGLMLMLASFLHPDSAEINVNEMQKRWYMSDDAQDAFEDFDHFMAYVLTREVQPAATFLMDADVEVGNQLFVPLDIDPEEPETTDSKELN